jgi:hypothetical protein
MSQDSLENQLFLEQRRLVVVLEGVEDRDVVSSWCGYKSLAVDAYAATDVEVPILDRFHGYGDNKARVASLIATERFSDYVDRSLIGIVDRDVDGVVRPWLEVLGLYYSEFCTLTSGVLFGTVLSGIMQESFGGVMSRDFIIEISRFYRRHYVLFALKERFSGGKGLPAVDKSVRRLVDGGFDWISYISKVKAVLGWKSSPERILSFLDRRSTDDDVRMVARYHDSLRYLWILSRKEGLIDKTVSLDEMYRHMRVHLMHLRQGRELELIENKTRALQAVL